MEVLACKSIQSPPPPPPPSRFKFQLGPTKPTQCSYLPSTDANVPEVAGLGGGRGAGGGGGGGFDVLLLYIAYTLLSRCLEIDMERAHAPLALLLSPSSSTLLKEDK